MKKRCKECKAYKAEGIQTPNAFYCSYEHATQHAQKLGQKRQAKIKREALKQARAEKAERKEKLKDRKWYLKKAQQVFNKWIRNRDENESCISCTTRTAKQWDAGHYRTTAAAGQLRFNEDGCNKQCIPCNHHKSGNVGEYRIGLIQKIGLERVEALENNNEVKKWTIDELKEIIEKYK